MNGVELEQVKQFNYLGRLLSEDDKDTKCINANLKKARKRWGSIANVLKREGANAVCMSKFYMAVVQAVLLYASESWTITEKDMKKLRSFHFRAIRHMTGEHIRKVTEEEWEHPDHEKLMKKCKLLSIETYIARRRGTLRKYLEEYRPNLLNDIKKVKRHSKDVHKILWWEQEYINKDEFDELAAKLNLKS